jgi:fumarylacetoacetase
MLEMAPLGAFSSKNLATTISPWIVTLDALERFRVAGTHTFGRAAAYLQPKQQLGHFSVQLQVDLEVDGSSTTMCKSQLEWLSWSFQDMIAHQTVNGCNLNSGDLLASGTVSGSVPGSNGCLLEMTGGKRPVKLSDGKFRRYLEDGDGVRLTGWAGKLGSDSCVGFGECFGVLQPAVKRR